MLIGFSLSNYKSFKTSQSISLLASQSPRHKEHIFHVNSRNILKSALIFGANAGGKSNLIDAVDFSRNIILNGLDTVDLSQKYFRIEKDMYLIPGIFEYRLHTAGSEYSYGIAISYARQEIVSEWLVRIGLDNTETYIYNREVDENGISHVSTDISYDNSEDSIRLQIYLEDFGSNISDTFRRKTILSDIANRGKNHQKIFTELANVYEWFTNIILIFPASKYTKINEIVANDTIKEFYSDLLSYFDTGIESVEGSHEEIDFDKILENTPKEKQEKIKLEILNKVSKGPAMFRINKKVYTLNMDETGNIIYNKILLNHGNMEDLFEYADESDGTKRLFDLIPLLYTSSANSVILIDEIDRSLHTNLTRQFLTLFYAIADRKSNQILATTHDSNLLDLDMVRQDEIWFIEREKDHSSKIYSLNKYRTRFDNKVNKEYLLGRYGAIPVFQNCSLVMEDEHE